MALAASIERAHTLCANLYRQMYDMFSAIKAQRLQ